MTKVVYDISISLDGYINARNPRLEAGLGDGGERLHDWAFASEDPHNKELVSHFPNIGAMIAGRFTYDLSIQYWGPNGPTGQARVPTVVVTHAAPKEVPENHVYSFVESIEEAAKKARQIAGTKDIAVMGGKSIGSQFLQAGLLDEVSVHLVPVLFGGGTRLFDEFDGEHVQLESIDVVNTKEALHLRFRVVK
ncbi:MAG TPA: dihydrofolate reductase family protein [Anaerolineales bacterium]|nr:dihydrofolate reductase family protein [Anaerolineales bacterium]